MDRHQPGGLSPGNESDEDQRLLAAAANGNAQAFRDLVARHADRLYRLAVSLVSHSADAEDVLQETFTGAFRGLNGFRKQSSVRTWLTQILVRQAAKVRRDRKRGPGRMDSIEASEDGPPLAASVAGGHALVERSIDLHAALKKLSPEHREVLVLREFEHQSYEELAVTLGVPRGTVESRLFRARSELKRLLAEYL